MHILPWFALAFSMVSLRKTLRHHFVAAAATALRSVTAAVEGTAMLIVGAA